MAFISHRLITVFYPSTISIFDPIDLQVARYENINCTKRYLKREKHVLVMLDLYTGMFG